MLSFVQSWFAPGANPVGVDFGTDCLRLAQVELTNGEFRLVAAACADVPSHVRNDVSARLTFFTETLRELWSQGNFRGRQAILALPAASMYIQHLRLPKMDDDALKKALPWEARGKLPIDPSHALLRHLVAGDVHNDQEPHSEVILMAARRDFIEQLLAAAAKARLDVIGMNVEPKAILDCFLNIYRRKADAEMTNCFVDIGCASTRAIVARGSQILFARTIPIGGEHFSRAVANDLHLPLEDAKVMRIRLASVGPDEQREKRNAIVEPPADSAPQDLTGENSFAFLSSAMAPAPARKPAAADGGIAVMEAPAAVRPMTAEATAQRESVDRAVREPLMKLVEELALCRRYHEATFPNRHIDRLIFIGGEARDRGLCQTIARELGIAAQVGDPLVRMGRISNIAIESGIDRRLPQPGWAVAIGLSMGSLATTPVKQEVQE